MPGYLDQYGVKEERREKIIKRIALVVISVAILAIVLYFLFRNYREERQVAQFLELLRQKDYHAAYRMWGCTPEQPCRDYAFDKFMEDWGPKTDHGDAALAKVSKTRSCSNGVIFTLEFSKGDPALLWVERKDKLLGFAPWPVCNPRMPAPTP